MNDPESQANEDGVFGNLPRERPGTRSPRRDDAAAKEKPKAAKATKGKSKSAAKPDAAPAKSKAAPAAKPKAAPRPHRSSAPPPDAPPPLPERPSGQPPIGSLEDAAWAGVTVAAQAATIGVKLASRAIESIRKSVERP